MTSFNPANFSLAENQFLLTALDEAPVIALSRVPTGVNRRAIEPLLRAIQELRDLENARGQKWVGTGPLKSAIEVYLERAQAWQADHKRGAPRWPSMHTFDGRGRPIASATGADTMTVKTYLGRDGKRHPFTVDLVPRELPEWVPEWVSADDAQPSADGVPLTDNRDVGRLECFCGHTEKYKDGVRASRTAARARMSKHLQKARERVDEHRATYALEFKR